jgi:hypothetical protein
MRVQPARRLRRKLLVACAMPALVASMSLAPAARAASPTIQQVIANNIASARSYKVVMDAAGGAFHMEMIVLAQGKVPVVYAKLSESALNVEFVVKGTKLCFSMAAMAGLWTCTNSTSSQFGALLKLNPTTVMHSFGTKYTLKPLASRKISGQSVLGYSFNTFSSAYGKAFGAVWLNPSNKSTVEEDVSVSTSVSGVTASSFKLIVNHFNDPKLSIPSGTGI